MSEEYMNRKQEDHTEQMEEMNPRRVLGLLVFLGIIVVQGFGCIRLGWSFPQIAAIYVIMAILLAIIFRFGPSEACQLFCKGAVRGVCGGFCCRACPVSRSAYESGLHHGYYCPRYVTASGKQKRHPCAPDHLYICDTV